MTADIVRLLGDVALPLITPFLADGEIDFSTLRVLLDRVLGQHLCDSLFIGGTTGEFQALSLDERVKLLEMAREIVQGRAPMVAGTGAITTRDTVTLTRQALALGYDAVAVIVPYYSRPTQEEIYQHFRTVGRSTAIAVIVYNIPLFVGVNLAPATLGRLATEPNIVAVKDSGTDPVQVSDYLQAAPNIAIYGGDDTMALQVLAQGGAGVVSGGAHIVGDLTREMVRLFKAGALKEATRLHQRLLPFYRALGGFGRANPVPGIREALGLSTGVNVGPPRRPLLPLTVDESAKLRDVLLDLRRLATEEVRSQPS